MYGVVLLSLPAFLPSAFVFFVLLVLTPNKGEGLAPLAPPIDPLLPADIYFYYLIQILLADGSCEGVVCDPNAECLRPFPEGRRQCKCKNGWQGEGRTCSGKPAQCL